MHGLWGIIHITVMTMANGTTVNAEQLVKLRKRTSASGNTILFLDYVQFGERVRESIGLTLLPGSTLAIKEKNRLTMSKAQAIRLEKEKQLLHGNRDLQERTECPRCGRPRAHGPDAPGDRRPLHGARPLPRKTLPFGLYSLHCAGSRPSKAMPRRGTLQGLSRKYSPLLHDIIVRSHRASFNHGDIIHR